MTPMTPTTFALAEGVVAAFTGRETGNLAHLRPHVPSELHASRRTLAATLGVEVADLHHLRQVHGGQVAVVEPETPRGAQFDGADALVTCESGRALVVQAADCVPVLVAADRGPVGAAHAGRNGISVDVVGKLVAAMVGMGAAADALHAAVGPAIGPCCYEVPPAMAREVADVLPDGNQFVATTTWGTTSLDLPSMAVAQLRRAGVQHVLESPGCTRCDAAGRWFSHRADPTAGRHAAAIVRSLTSTAVAA